MSMTQEAMKLALEALESVTRHFTRTPSTLRDSEVRGEAHKAITALRKALAEQPAQQVVDSDEKAGAYMDARLWEFIDMAAAWPKASPDPRIWNHVVVYAPKPAQRTWVGLEGEEIRNLWEEATKPDRSTMTMVTSFAKSIEAKLKQKNHVAQETN